MRAYLCLAVAAALGCGGPRYVEVDAGRQAYYRTGYPLHDASRALEQIFASVKQIHVTVAYDSYLFAEEVAPTVADMPDPGARARALDAADVVSFTRTRAATAVAIASRAGRVTLLTASHAVQHPDTVYDYFGGADRRARQPDTRIRSLSVKRRQTNWVIGPYGVRNFDILAYDEPLDLALLGFRASGPDEARQVRVLTARAGDAARLALGSFVYVLGFPAGYPMVTRGIASPQPEGSPSAFVVDGLWNEGMSGGLILGVRGQGGALEWLGMVRAAAADIELRLAPPEGVVEDHDRDLPYEGPIFLEESRRIRYGIMLPVSITEIRRFLDRHRAELRRMGYELPRV